MAPMMDLRPLPKWRTLARTELTSMKNAISALPLADRLKRSIADFRRYRKMIVLFPSGGPRKESEARESDKGLAEFLEHVEELKKGGNVHLDARRIDPIPPDYFLESLVTFTAEGEGDTALVRIDDSIRKVKEWRDGRVIHIREELKRFKNDDGVIYDGELNGFVDLRRTVILLNDFSKRADKAAVKLINAAASLALMKSLEKAIGNEEMMELSELLSRGVDEVKRFLRLQGQAKKAFYPSERIRIKKSIYSLACPKALAALREQWMREEKVERPYYLGFGDEPAPPAPPPEKRTENEDIGVLKDDFPGLYKKMMKPTPEEEEQRRLKNLAKRMRRKGVDHEEIHRRLRLESGSMSVPPAPEQAPPGRSKRARRPARTERASATARQNGPKSREELIASIRLSAAAEMAIRGQGFRPADIVFSLFKGFNLGAGVAAVGSGHFRGVYIRKNIRNYLKREYAGNMGEAPKVADILDYLKSIDLVREFGSGPTTKTKDDAMSINTNPDHPIGSDIMTTINAALVGLRNR